MGQRANLFICRHGVYKQYYDHWAANRLDLELIWGPPIVLAWIESRAPVDDSYLLDEVWCEGAALVDTDARRLLWWGGEDTLYELDRRRMVFGLLQETWPGWDVRWANKGLAEVLVATHRVIDRHDLVPNSASPRKLVVSDVPEYNDCILSWKKDGLTHVRRVVASWECLLNPSQYMEPFEWPVHECEGEFANFQGGMHVDHDQHALRFWWAHPTSIEIDRVPPAWTGWTVIDDGDDPNVHLTLLGNSVGLSPRDPRCLAFSFLDTLEQRLEQLPLVNPANGIAARLEAEGHDVQVSPVVEHHREGGSSIEAQRAIVSQLRSRLNGGWIPGV